MAEVYDSRRETPQAKAEGKTMSLSCHQKCAGQRGTTKELTVSFTFEVDAQQFLEWEWPTPTMRWDDEKGQLIIQFYKKGEVS